MPPNLEHSWKSYPDHYTVQLYSTIFPPTSFDDLLPLPIEDLNICQPCLEIHLLALDKQETILQHSGQLRCLELFAGAGGLSTGMELSRFVKTKWAVEIDSSAALSFQ